eukprot:Hpha_TRINITY_DN15176_c0_g24::TRINITY_DN15176_c0_g24_i1::g.127845::m.127845/K14779/DDX52, ROK1; ATP-dependent RNA helicase DDX52/ROK1
MDDARLTAFHQLIPGARFEKKRFQSDIARFKHAGSAQETLKSRLPGLDFFETGKKEQKPAVPPPAAVSKRKRGDESSDDDDEDEDGEEEKPKAPVVRIGKRRADAVRKEHGIKVAGKDVPPPIVDFAVVAADNNVPEYMTANMRARGIEKPTPIQMQAVPCLLKGRDLLAVAPTGSGKTLAFLLPVLLALGKPRRRGGVRGVVLAHTKELAQQTERELRALVKGGDKWRIHTTEMAKSWVGSCDLVVSTPGRLAAMVKDKVADFSSVMHVVVDEADRLFDQSHEAFSEALTTILGAMPKSRTLSVFSATMPEKAEGMMREHLRNPCRVMIGARAAASSEVTQSLMYCGKEQGKATAIKDMLRQGIDPPVLIFVDKIERAKDLYQEFRVMGYEAAAIHSDRTAAQRDATVRDFRTGKCNILVCTELLGRGVDFKGVGTVINYDFPMSTTSYVHRVGRTGRAGKKGKAVTLWTDEDKDNLRGVAKIIDAAGGEVPQWMLELPKRRSGKRRKSSEFFPVKRETLSAVRRVREAEARKRQRGGGQKVKRGPGDSGGDRKRRRKEE